MQEQITRSLELLTDRVGDPVPLVYARVFEQHPEMKPLFILDTDDSVKGNMLATVIDLIFDQLDGGAYAKSFIESEIVNHENLGVPRDVFTSYFSTVMEAFKDVLGADWSPEMDAAWAALVKDLSSTGQ